MAEIYIEKLSKGQQEICDTCPFKVDPDIGSTFCNPAVIERNWNKKPSIQEISEVLGTGSIPAVCPNDY